VRRFDYPFQIVDAKRYIFDSVAMLHQMVADFMVIWEKSGLENKNDLNQQVMYHFPSRFLTFPCLMACAVVSRLFVSNPR
jgi:hypothetical protein